MSSWSSSYIIGVCERKRQTRLSLLQSLSLGYWLQNWRREQIAVSAVSRSCVYFHASREDSTDTCSICLAAFTEGEHLARRTACNNKFHAICLFEWRQGQRARYPLCRRHLYAYSTPATQPQLSDLREGPKVEIVRLPLTLEVVTTSQRTTASGIAVRDLRGNLVRSGQFRQTLKCGHWHDLHGKWESEGPIERQGRLWYRLKDSVPEVTSPTAASG